MVEPDEGGNPPGGVDEPREMTIEFVDHEEGPHTVSGEIPVEIQAEASAPAAEGAGAQTERLQQLEDMVLRQRADFENFKRRAERDRAEVSDRARAALVKEILPVLDNMDRALAILEKEAPAEWCKGMELVHQMFLDTLLKAGAEPMEALGRPFDPQYHEAVTLTEDPALPDGAVADVLERGYLFRGKVLRVARVRVNRLQRETAEEAPNG